MPAVLFLFHSNSIVSLNGVLLWHRNILNKFPCRLHAEIDTMWAATTHLISLHPSIGKKYHVGCHNTSHFTPSVYRKKMLCFDPCVIFVHAWQPRGRSHGLLLPDWLSRDTYYHHKSFLVYPSSWLIMRTWQFIW